MDEPFMLDALADRIEIIIRRYNLYMLEIPRRIGPWVESMLAQKRVFVNLESACADLFKEDKPRLERTPHHWIQSVAVCALKNWLASQTHNGVELSSCGKSLRIFGSSSAKRPDDSVFLRECLLSATCEAGRAAVLEVKAARQKALLPPKEAGAAGVFAYLTEARAEALEALSALKQQQSKRNALVAANTEIQRLSLELSESRRRKRAVSFACGFFSPHNLIPAQDDTDDEELIHPKRALSMAGYWNLEPNDLMLASRRLTELVAERGGKVVRRKGMHACFSPGTDGRLIEDVAVQVMTEEFSQYKRRAPD